VIAAVTHLGSWDIQGGEMIFQRMVDSSAPMSIAAGATATFSGGSLTPSIFRSGTNFTGEGLVENSTTTEIETGATVDAQNIDLASGNLKGGGSLRINHEGTWKGGQISGSLTLQVMPDATFRVDGSGSRTIGSSSTPHFDNDGLFELTGTAQISSNGSATFDNSGTLFLD
ncbi:MAG: hypothetical protein GY953_48535, partial [bacterium]|nr:hypothetical protein [bacterium]